MKSKKKRLFALSIACYSACKSDLLAFMNIISDIDLIQKDITHHLHLR